MGDLHLIAVFWLTANSFFFNFVACDPVHTSTTHFNEKSVISNPYVDLFACDSTPKNGISDDAQLEANFGPKIKENELKTYKKQDSVFPGQHGKIWAFKNNSLLHNTLCKLEIVACASCLIEISWKNKPKSSNLGNLKSFKEAVGKKCDRQWEFKDNPCVGINILEEDANGLFAYKTYYTKVSPLISTFGAAAENLNNSEWQAQNHQINEFTGSSNLVTGKLPENQFVSTSFKIEIAIYAWLADFSISSMVNDFLPLEYTVISNNVIRRGKSASNSVKFIQSEGFVQSPRYPRSYPERIIVNYTLINEDSSGFVRLIFSDYQLYYLSSLQILDSDGSLLASSSSHNLESARPCATQSSGPFLTVIFKANLYSQEIGFRAHYKFVAENFWPEKPVCKACDKQLEDKGGVISAENLLTEFGSQHVDCIWLLSKPHFGLPFYDKIYAKVEDFSMGGAGRPPVQLEVRGGLTSQSELLLNLFGPKTKQQLAGLQPHGGFVVELQNRDLSGDLERKGFYVRFRGFLDSDTNSMEIAFAQFYKWATAICHDINEFHCDNGRCISLKFFCDGYDHCGDMSDESADQCNKNFGGWQTFINPQDNRLVNRGRTRPHLSIGDPSSPLLMNLDYRTPMSYSSTLLLVSALIGLVLVVLMVAILAARVYKRRLLLGRSTADQPGAPMFARIWGDGSSRHASRLQNEIVEDSGFGSRPGPSIHQIGNRRLFIVPDAAVGVFEAPPTYDDALKHPTVPPDSVAPLPTRHLANSSSLTNPSFVSDDGIDAIESNAVEDRNNARETNSGDVTLNNQRPALPAALSLSACPSHSPPPYFFDQSSSGTCSQVDQSNEDTLSDSPTLESENSENVIDCGIDNHAPAGLANNVGVRHTPTLSAESSGVATNDGTCVNIDDVIKKQGGTVNEQLSTGGLVSNGLDATWFSVQSNKALRNVIQWMNRSKMDDSKFVRNSRVTVDSAAVRNSDNEAVLGSNSSSGAPSRRLCDDEGSLEMRGTLV